METFKQKYLRQLEELIDEGQELKILTLIAKVHPDDIAELIDGLEEEKRSKLFRLLDIDTASDVIMALNDISRELILEDISKERLTELVEDMPSDDAADLIGDLSTEQALQVLGSIDGEKSKQLQKLLSYPEDTAGGIMQTELISLDQNCTVKEATEFIRQKAEILENFHNVFVTDEGSRLVGSLPLKKLLLAKELTPLRDIMNTSVHYVHPEIDQEEVATIFRKYDIVSMPVVDHDKRIIGRILVDDILDVMQEEGSEDMLMMAGISQEESIVYSDNISGICRTRLPWLLINLGGTFLSAFFLWIYEPMFSEILALVSFVPVVCAMSGNVSVQSSTIIIRGLAIGKIDIHRLRKTLFREFTVGTILGVCCGLIGGVFGLLWRGDSILGLVIFVSMFLTITYAAIMGLLLPLLFRKLKVDPAVASGALLSTTNDVVAINVYFILAIIFFKAIFV